MYQSGETADQVVRMTLQGIEVAANVALKAGGAASRSLAATLYAIITDNKKIKGRTRLDNMLKSGKELKVFAIRHEDLKIFCEEAKRYGVLYSVLKEKNNTSGICEIMVRAEDAAKISRIVDKFELATIDTKAIKEAILAQRENKDITPLSDKEHDDLVNKLMNDSNPIKARTEKSDNQFEPTYRKQNVAKDSLTDRPSVRKELEQIKKDRELKPNVKDKTKTIGNKTRPKNMKRGIR